MSLTEAVVNSSILIGALIFGAATFYTNYKNGGSKAAKEVIDMRASQIQALRDELTRLTTERKEDQDRFNSEIKSLTVKVGELTGNLNARNGEVERLTALLTARNPEMDNFFKESGKLFERLVPVLDKIEQHLNLENKQ